MTKQHPVLAKYFLKETKDKKTKVCQEILPAISGVPAPTLVIFSLPVAEYDTLFKLLWN